MKRALDVSDINDEGTHTICGTVTSLSPVKTSKKGRNYFKGSLSDGNRDMTFACFDPQQKDIFEDSKQENTLLTLTNCRVKEYDGALEIEVCDYTKVSVNCLPNTYLIP